MSVPLADQLREVEREIEARRKIYAYRIEQGLMDNRRAARKLALMEAVAETLRGLSNADKEGVGVLGQ